MPDVTVHLTCKGCRYIDEFGVVEYQEMVGEDSMFENEDSRIQLRNYSCPSCGNEVNVVLDFRGN